MFSRQALRSIRAVGPHRRLARTPVRYYAAPAAQQDVHPPIAVYGLDGTYATALVRKRSLMALRCDVLFEEPKKIGPFN